MGQAAHTAVVHAFKVGIDYQVVLVLDKLCIADCRGQCGHHRCIGSNGSCISTLILDLAEVKGEIASPEFCLSGFRAILLVFSINVLVLVGSSMTFHERARPEIAHMFDPSVGDFTALR